MTPTPHHRPLDLLHQWDEPREEGLFFARLCRPLRAERSRATVNAALQRKQTAAAADSESRTRTVKETTLSRLAQDTYTHTHAHLSASGGSALPPVGCSAHTRWVTLPSPP